MSQMSQGSTGSDAAAQELSAGELVAQLTEQVATLVRDELKLAQVEMTRKGRQAGLGAGLLGGGLIALYGAACLIACAVIGSATWCSRGWLPSSSGQPCWLSPAWPP